MKTIKTILLLSVSAIFLVSCSSSLQQRQFADDLYYSPDKQQNREIIEEFEKDYEKAIAENEQKEQQGATQNDTVMDFKKSTNPYEDVLADNMEEAYKRRVQARRDFSYGMGDYYSVINSDDYWYASTYDPAFYNMIISGNSVWVEPKWISTGYGYGYNYGNFYNRPMYSWGFGFSHYPYSMSSYHSYSYHPYTYRYGYEYGSYGYYNSPFSFKKYPYEGFYNSAIYNGVWNPWVYSMPTTRKNTDRKHNKLDTRNLNNQVLSRYYVDSKANNENKSERNQAERQIESKNNNISRNRTYIRKSESSNNRNSIARNYARNNRVSQNENTNKNSVRGYINNNERRGNVRSTNRYYQRPKQESNYSELSNKKRRSYNNNSGSSNRSKRYYRNNSSSSSSTKSSSYNSGNTSTNSSNNNSTRSSSNSSSSSGRKKR